MLAKVYSAAVVGLDAIPIEVEVDIAATGLPSFTIVGLPDKAVEESKERVRTAIKNSGADFPSKRITVNLAPADLPKEGPAYDLPIALGVLLASGQLDADVGDSLVVGELSLDGSLRRTNGVLSCALMGKQQQFKRLFLPATDAKEAAIITGITVYPISSLTVLFHHLQGEVFVPSQPEVFGEEWFHVNYEGEFDMKDIVGQEFAKRALEVAAAGGHNILFKGPPGAGKTLLARTLPSILPQLTLEEALEVTKVYSVLGLTSQAEPLVKVRPFRTPHHTTSHVGLVGGGNHPRPGEISLAHHGVLFLDELPEFPRHVLESLRQPLEDGWVTVSRAAGTVRFPARFMLVAAQNPCPCGFLGDQNKACVCSVGQISRYQKRISGPLLDRIDLHIMVPAVQVEKLTGKLQAEPSQKIQKRVQKARDLQIKRFKGLKIKSNAEMNNKQLKQFCDLDEQSIILLKQAISKLNLSARVFHRIIKIGRTIADLDDSVKIKSNHLAEALQYRPQTEL